MISRDLGGLRFSLVGPGRVGASLARWATAAGAGAVSVAGRTPATTAALAASLGAAPVLVEELASGGQDFLLLAVPDGALATLAATLARQPQAAVAWHTAGACDASALAPLRKAGSAVGSLHPLRAFPAAQAEPAAGTFYALDGDAPAIALARRLVAAWGGVAGEVPAEARQLYHLGAWLSAGGVATLVAAAASLAAELGLHDSVGAAYRHLAVGALQALGDGAERAARITGPVARGDRELLARQLAELERVAPETVPLVRELALETLRQIARTRPLDQRQLSLRTALADGLIP